MSTKTTTARKPGDLGLPLYASKPQRRIPGTHFVAVTMNKSADGTVAAYAIIREDGEAHLGTAHLQMKRRYQARGYTLNSVPRSGEESWDNLTAFVVEMAKRNGIEA